MLHHYWIISFIEKRMISSTFSKLQLSELVLKTSQAWEIPEWNASPFWPMNFLQYKFLYPNVMIFNLWLPF